AVIGAPDEQVDVNALRTRATGPPADAQARAAAADVPQGGAMGAVAAPAGTPGAAPAPAEVQQPPPGPAPLPAPAQPQPAPSGQAAPASPIARKMAAEAGVDIRLIAGTGPGGRITKKDVEAFLRSPQAAPQPAAAPSAPREAVTPTAAAEDQTIPLTRLRQIIARRMTESKQTVPQFYVTTEVDVAAALDLRKQINALLPEERKVSVNDFIVKATALALRAFPNLNASFAGDKVIRKGRVNVGIAVALEGGLLTVVVKDADQKPLAQIGAEARAMAARAREGKVQGGDIEGSTFSISNLGLPVFGEVDHFIAIVNPPEAGILATGAVREAPVVKNGALGVGQRMKITCSADHRVTDGAEVAQFLQAVRKNLEEPLRLLV
ncbi:MAG: dihydrolipoamide acetyltransferase family protein, partial [Anaerolineales bacterium]